METWQYILTVAIFINTLSITPSSSLKFKGCGDKFDDGKKFSDDFQKAADFILNDWDDFENTVEKEAKVKIGKCLKRRLQKGKVTCIAPNRKWPYNCNGNWCGSTAPSRRNINICEPNFLNRLKDDDEVCAHNCIPKTKHIN